MSTSTPTPQQRTPWWRRFLDAVRYVARLEPVTVQAVIRATLLLVGAVLAGVGLELPAGLEPWLLGVVVAFYALVEVVTTSRARRRSVPAAAVVERVEGGTVVAGEASELVTDQPIRPAGSLEGGSGLFPQA